MSAKSLKFFLMRPFASILEKNSPEKKSQNSRKQSGKQFNILV